MNIYLISQDRNSNYDTFDSAIVAAESFNEAAQIHPLGKAEGWQNNKHAFDDWVSPEFVKVALIGAAAPDIKKGVVLGSYNAS